MTLGRLKVSLGILWRDFGDTLGILLGDSGDTLGILWGDSGETGDTLARLWGYSGNTVGRLWGYPVNTLRDSGDTLSVYKYLSNYLNDLARKLKFWRLDKCEITSVLDNYCTKTFSLLKTTF